MNHNDEEAQPIIVKKMRMEKKWDGNNKHKYGDWDVYLDKGNLEHVIAVTIYKSGKEETYRIKKGRFIDFALKHFKEEIKQKLTIKEL